MPDLQRFYKPQKERRKEAGEMTLEEYKQIIEARTGIPSTLLTGETAEENIAQAKAILAYKRECDKNNPKSTRELFKEWIEAGEGIENQDTAGQALAEIEEAARIQAGGYPIIKDGGSVNINLGDGRSAREQFSEWIGQKAAFNPFADPDGWTHLY